MVIFNRAEFETAASLLSEHYEKSAPTVAEWAERMYQAKDNEITLADIHLMQMWSQELPQPNHAANRLYHHQTSLGRETVGHAGF